MKTKDLIKNGIKTIGGLLILAVVLLISLSFEQKTPIQEESLDYFSYNRALFDKHQEAIKQGITKLYAAKAGYPQVTYEVMQDSIIPGMFCIQHYLSANEIIGICYYMGAFGCDNFTQNAVIELLNQDKPALDCAETLCSYRPQDNLTNEQIKQRWLCGAVLAGRFSVAQFIQGMQQKNTEQIKKLYFLKNGKYVPRYDKEI